MVDRPEESADSEAMNYLGLKLSGRLSSLFPDVPGHFSTLVSK